MVDQSIDYQLSVNAACADARAKKGASSSNAGPFFIAVEGRGLFGRMFTDLGDAFVTTDNNGEAPRTGMIASIVKVASYLELAADPLGVSFSTLFFAFAGKPWCSHHH